MYKNNRCRNFIFFLLFLNGMCIVFATFVASRSEVGSKIDGIE
jgi:hypothetical protein